MRLREFIDRYFAERPRVREYLDRVVDEARDRGYSETLFGRQRQVPELRAPDRNLQQAGRRIALNNPIQGSAADIIKVAMIRVARELDRRKLGTRMILQVHDELVFEVPGKERDEAAGIVREAMEGVAALRVPLKVRLGFGPNWADAKVGIIISLVRVSISKRVKGIILADPRSLEEGTRERGNRANWFPGGPGTYYRRTGRRTESGRPMPFTASYRRPGTSCTPGRPSSPSRPGP